MNTLEVQLRVSVIQQELFSLAKLIGGSAGRVLAHAASVLNLVTKA